MKVLKISLSPHYQTETSLLSKYHPFKEQRLLTAVEFLVQSPNSIKVEQLAEHRTFKN